MKNKVLSLLGLSMRSRKAVSGEFSVEKAVKDRSAKLVLVASDASDNTKKKFHDMCSYRNIPIIEYSVKDELGHALGQEFRACAACLDAGLSEAILKEAQKDEVSE